MTVDLCTGDMLAAVYLTTGKIAPDFQQLELHVGGATVATAVSEATGVTKGQLRRMHDVLGDLGDVAQECRVKQVGHLPHNLVCLDCMAIAVFSLVVSQENAAGAGDFAQHAAALATKSRCQGVGICCTPHPSPMHDISFSKLTEAQAGIIGRPSRLTSLLGLLPLNQMSAMGSTPVACRAC